MPYFGIKGVGKKLMPTEKRYFNKYWSYESKTKNY